MVMTINKRIKRIFLENKLQYIGAGLLIFFSCFMFSLMVQFCTNYSIMNDSFKKDYVQETASFETAEPISDIPRLQLETGALVEEYYSFDAVLESGKTLRVLTENQKVNLPAVLAGAPAKEGELLLSPSFADANGLKLGDSIHIEGKPYVVSGFMALPNYIFPLENDADMMSSPKSFGVAVMAGDDFAGFTTAKRAYAVRFSGAENSPWASAEAFRGALAKQGITPTKWLDAADNKRMAYIEMELQIMSVVGLVMPGFVLLLAALMVSIVLRRLISHETQALGTLYSFGYRKGEMLRHYLSLPVLLTITAAALGTAAGMLGAPAMLSMMNLYFIIPVTRLTLSVQTALLAIAAPVLLVCLSSYLSVRKKLTLSPSQLMRGKEQKSRVNFIEKSVKLERLPFAARFKVREQLRSLSRLFLLLFGVAIAAVLMLYGLTAKSSVDYYLDKSITGTYQFEYEYMYNQPHYNPIPQEAEGFSALNCYAKENEKIEFYISGVQPNSRLLTLFDKKGNKLGTDKTVVTRPLANNLKLSVGSVLSVVEKQSGKKYSVEVESIAETYAGKYIFMPLDEFNRQFDLPEGSHGGIWSVKELALPKDELYSVKSQQSSKAAIMELILPTQIAVTVLSVIAFFMGLIVIYLVTSLLVAENRQSISLLKIFGYRRREINGLILNSSTVVVVLGYLLGLPMIFSSMTAIFAFLDSAAGLAMPLKISPVYVLFSFIVMLLSYEASKRLCRKKVDAISMSEALKAGTE